MMQIDSVPNRDMVFNLMHSGYAKWCTFNPSKNCLTLQIPTWCEWGLSIGVDHQTSPEEIQRGYEQHNMVAGTLSHDVTKAEAYKQGTLNYFAIVEEIEKQRAA